MLNTTGGNSDAKGVFLVTHEEIHRCEVKMFICWTGTPDSRLLKNICSCKSCISDFATLFVFQVSTHRAHNNKTLWGIGFLWHLAVQFSNERKIEKWKTEFGIARNVLFASEAKTGKFRLFFFMLLPWHLMKWKSPKKKNQCFFLFFFPWRNGSLVTTQLSSLSACHH